MNGRAFVDTNILMYAQDASTGAKHDRARQLVEQLWESGSGVLSTQVLQELCVNVRRKVRKPLSSQETHRLVQNYLNWQIVVNDTVAIVQALDFEKSYQVSFWSALILQAAETAGVEVLYSEDLASGRKYGSFRVQNPFTDLP